MQFPVGGPLKPLLYLASFFEILCVKHIAKHIPIESALIPIFSVLGAKLGVIAFCNFVLVAAS